MQVLEDLKILIDRSDLENPDKLKQQLELLARLPGEYNQQVFDKLYELACHDPQAIVIFIRQFIDTSVKLLNK